VSQGFVGLNALKIFDGSKRYEYRRSIFKREEVATVVVYASYPIKRVIGEFEIEEILHEGLEALWKKTECYAGITKKRFLDYFENREKGYAIKVKEARIYNTPIPLNKLMVLCPPQSFTYL